MSKFVSILSGITLALIIGLIIQEKFIGKSPVKSPTKPQVAGLKIEYGDENVPLLSKEEFLEDKLSALIIGKSGTYSVGVKVLDSNFSVFVNSNERFYPASLYKVPLAMGILKNYEDSAISLTDKLVLEEKHISDGSGTLADFEPGTEFKILDLLNYLIKQSDNTAQEMLITKANFNIVYRLMNKDELITSPQIIRIFEDIHKGTYLDEDATSLLVDLLIGTSFDNRIHDGLPSDVKLAHKIGNWPETGTWHDCGIIFDKQDIAVCVLSKNTTYEEFREVTKEFGELISNYFDI